MGQRITFQFEYGPDARQQSRLTRAEVGFDGCMTSQVFTYMPDRAVQSSRFMQQKIQEYVDKYWGTK